MPRVDPAEVDASTADPAIRRASGRRSVAVLVGIVLLLFLLATRVVPHPVGPARTFDKYQGKAVTTAESALSNVRTAAMVARAHRAGDAFGPYTAVVLGDAEEGVSGLQSTFDSIQPPDETADVVADELDALLVSASDHVRSVRVSVRRGQQASDEQLADLDRDADDLEAFVEANS